MINILRIQTLLTIFLCLFAGVLFIIYYKKENIYLLKRKMYFNSLYEMGYEKIRNNILEYNEKLGEIKTKIADNIDFDEWCRVFYKSYINKNEEINKLISQVQKVNPENRITYKNKRFFKRKKKLLVIYDQIDIFQEKFPERNFIFQDCIKLVVNISFFVFCGIVIFFTFIYGLLHGVLKLIFIKYIFLLLLWIFIFMCIVFIFCIVCINVFQNSPLSLICIFIYHELKAIININIILYIATLILGMLFLGGLIICNQMQDVLFTLWHQYHMTYLLLLMFMDLAAITFIIYTSQNIIKISKYNRDIYSTILNIEQIIDNLKENKRSMEVLTLTLEHYNKIACDNVIELYKDCKRTLFGKVKVNNPKKVVETYAIIKLLQLVGQTSFCDFKQSLDSLKLKEVLENIKKIDF